MTENWRPVIGYVDNYEVSDQGRVRRIKSGRGARPGLILRSTKHGQGYLGVTLYHDDVRKRFTVHSLVATAFIGRRSSGLQVNHMDLDKSNNRVGNLEYVTATENQRHALSARPWIKNQKLHSSDISAIRSLREKGWTLIRIAQKYKVHIETIRNVTLHKTWRRP